MNMKTQTHTPGPWFVMADPLNKGKHPYHDARYITTSPEHYLYEDRFGDKQWAFEQDDAVIICAMRDSENQKPNARLIAAAPDLLAACQAALERLEASQPPANGATETVCKQLKAAIAKATEGI